MSPAGPYSPYTEEAARLLGAQIAAGRRERRWSALELADRLGINRETLRKIERGDPSVRLGTSFEAARLVGVPLFHETLDELRGETARRRDRLSLLPQRIRESNEPVDDDF
jgi:transcriptional regulator with XRE-family HTH domain